MSSQEAAEHGLGRPIRGPRALTDDWSRFWHLTYNIARNEFKLRFFGSVLGYLWQLMRPLLLFGVLYVFFTKVALVNRNFPACEPGIAVEFSATLRDFEMQLCSGCVASVIRWLPKRALVTWPTVLKALIVPRRVPNRLVATTR